MIPPQTSRLLFAPVEAIYSLIPHHSRGNKTVHTPYPWRDMPILDPTYAICPPSKQLNSS